MFDTEWFEGLLWDYRMRYGFPAGFAAMPSTMFWYYFEGDSGDDHPGAEFVLYRSDSQRDVFIVPSPYLVSPNVVLGQDEIPHVLGFRALYWDRGNPPAERDYAGWTGLDDATPTPS